MLSDKRDVLNMQCNAGLQGLFCDLQSHYLKDVFKRGFASLAGEYLINIVTLYAESAGEPRCSQCGTFSLHLMVQQMILSEQVHCHTSTFTWYCQQTNIWWNPEHNYSNSQCVCSFTHLSVLKASIYWD